jgi:hypothetical protein
MKQRLIMLAAAWLVPLLAACGPATPPPAAEVTDTPVAAVASPTVPGPATSTPAPTSTPAGVAEATPEAQVAFPTPNPNPECVAEPIPEDPNIPPVTADEWSEGPDDASISLVEYSDFQ